MGSSPTRPTDVDAGQRPTTKGPPRAAVVSRTRRIAGSSAICNRSTWLQYQWRSPAWSSWVPRTCPGGGLPHRERPRLVSGPAGALRRAPSPCEESPVSGLSGPRLARHPRRVTNCGRKERLSPPQRVSRPETDGVGDDHLGFKADRIAAWRTLGRASGTPPSRVRGAAPRGALMDALSAPRPRDLLLLKRTSGVCF